MLSPVPLHSNILFQILSLYLGQKKHQQRSDVHSFHSAQTQEVVLPDMEVAALPQAPLLSAGKKQSPSQ